MGRLMRKDSAQLKNVTKSLAHIMLTSQTDKMNIPQIQQKHIKLSILRRFYLGIGL